MITVYNSHLEDHTSDKNNFYIGRKSPLGNPFTFDGKRSKLAELSFKTREEALKAYELYFESEYGKNNDLTKEFDKIYQRYKEGNDIYLQCFCKPEKCHGDFIKKMLQQKLIKDKMVNKTTNKAI